jgi:FkbM family methyltransferase
MNELIKKILLPLWFWYEKICYFLRFIKLYIYQDKKNIYQYSLKDRFLGAKLAIYGFGNKDITEKITDVDSSFCKVRVKDKNIIVPKKVFQKGEIAYAYQEIFTPCSKNPHSYENDILQVKKEDVVIDAGACEGFFTLCSLQKRAKKVYCFEPLNILCSSLKKTFASDIKKGKCFVIQKGLSDKVAQRRFSSQMQTISMSAFDNHGNGRVETITIDCFVKEKNLKKIDFIKMDIEGAEVDAIKGARLVLKHLKPKLSIAVYHNYKNAEILKNLILKINNSYQIKFSGCFVFEKPYRPFMLYAY